MTRTRPHDGLAPSTAACVDGQVCPIARATQERLESALATEREAVERLRALDDARTDFISTVSHELRTPLTTIQGYTDVLLEGDVGELSADQQRVVERIDRSAQRLRRQVEDLLLLVEVDSGDFSARRTPLELAAVVATALGELDEQARERVDLDLGKAPSTVLGDGCRLVGVVGRIVGNALKFSGPLDRVDVRLRREGDQEVVEVTDTGVGIPRAEQQHLFERFFRSANTQAIAAQGLGLGLAVAAAVVAAHDGDISITSVEGTGTTVLIRLPAYDASAAVEPDSGADSGPALWTDRLRSTPAPS